MNPLVPVALGLVGAVVSFLGATALARRQHSGKIDTTEATKLWDEAQAMRKELRDESVALRAEVVALKAEVIAMREEMVANRKEGADRRSESDTMRKEITALLEEREAMRQQIADLEARLGTEGDGL